MDGGGSEFSTEYVVFFSISSSFSSFFCGGLGGGEGNFILMFTPTVRLFVGCQTSLRASLRAKVSFFFLKLVYCFFLVQFSVSSFSSMRVP